MVFSLEFLKETWKKFLWRGNIFLRWILFAVVIGFVVGPISVCFVVGITKVTALREANPWLLYLLPPAGVAIVWLYRICRYPGGGNTNFVLTAVRENEPMPLRAAPLIFVTTILTHLVGGSAGREGAALQLGGSISGYIGKKMHLDDKDARVITMCGMSAAFSAMFGTPLTAAVFSMEVVSVGVMYYVALVPCVVASVLSAWTASMLGVAPTHFILSAVPATTPLSMLQTAGLGVLFAFLSLLFCRVMHWAPKLYQKYLTNPYVRAAVGGALVIVLTLLCGTRDYNGAGGPVIALAISGSAAPFAFLLKMLFTAVTLGAGFKGGEIVPVFFVGATFGCVAAPLLGLPAAFGAALGLVSVFCGVTNSPLTSLLLTAELFGGAGLPLFAISLAVSFMLSGYSGLYSEQKIVYSKFKAQFIDRKTS